MAGSVSCWTGSSTRWTRPGPPPRSPFSPRPRSGPDSPVRLRTPFSACPGSGPGTDKGIRRGIHQAAHGGGPQRLPTTVSVGGQRSHVCVFPLHSRSRTLGVLAFGRVTPLDAVEFAAANELVRRAGLAVDNARL